MKLGRDVKVHLPEEQIGRDVFMEYKLRHMRLIPSVDELLHRKSIQMLTMEIPRNLIVNSIRNVLDRKRKAISNVSDKDQLENMDLAIESLEKEIIEHARKELLPNLRRVVNATGVIVHTNLGRSLIAKEIIPHLVDIATRYSNLEYDLELGERGSRYSHVEKILCDLSGAESAIVVNNNAGAVLICLNTLAAGKEVIVSRGELVEIGGSFRMPDVMRQSGARLVEVGTTNRTHLRDYEESITPETALLLKVHTSNYRILGFTSEVELQDLVRLGQNRGIPVMKDLGSGCLIDFREYGLEREPTVQEAVKSGADVITFSGDKLLGGPQAGIIVGKRECIERIRKNPLNRALRIDKLTLAALEGTLRFYIKEERALQTLPTLKMITLPYKKLRRRALYILKRVTRISRSWDLSVRKDISRVGGGAFPILEIPTAVIAIRSFDERIQKLEKMLRKKEPPIIARLSREELILDVRTIQEDEDKYVIEVLNDLLGDDQWK